MSIDHGVKLFERLANAIGPGAALKVCGFYGQGGCTVYVPTSVPVYGHRLEKLLGREAFEYLVSEFGGETISVPRLSCLDVLRRAGSIAALSAYKVPTSIIADSLDIGQRRVKQIADQLRREGFAGLLDDTEGEASHAQ